MYPMYSRRIAPRLPLRASSRCASLADRNSNLGNPALLKFSTVRCNVSYHRVSRTVSAVNTAPGLHRRPEICRGDHRTIPERRMPHQPETGQTGVDVAYPASSSRQ